MPSFPNTLWRCHSTVRGLRKRRADSLKTIGITRLGVFPYQLATDGATAWAGDGFYGTITPIDHTGREFSTFRPQLGATGRLALASGAGALWVGSQDGALTEIDSQSERAIAVLRHTGDPEALAVGAGSVWVAEAGQDDVRQIDPVTTASRDPYRSEARPPMSPLGMDQSGQSHHPNPACGARPAHRRRDRRHRRCSAVLANHRDRRQNLGRISYRNPSTARSQSERRRSDGQTDGPIGGMAPGDHRLWISVR
jgi:hypothetical protein